jgi:hypothetical protein
MADWKGPEGGVFLLVNKGEEGKIQIEEENSFDWSQED